MAAKSLNILLIANDTGNIEVVRRALENNRTQCRLHMIGTGPTAIPYLRREGPYTNAPEPDLILFDLVNAASASLGTLRQIKDGDIAGDAPVVLLTRDPDDPDDSQGDIEVDMEEYATFSPVELDSFLDALSAIKPIRFVKAITLLGQHGFVLVRMPR